MSRVFVSGLGAVCPAGWGMAPFREALRDNVPLPMKPLDLPSRPRAINGRLVPPPMPRPAFLAHPRLRRASPITHYAAAAGIEALARLPANPPAPRRLGLVLCLQSGCVQYSGRFFEEVLKDPATASPLLFPETVYAAIASHIATLLGGVCVGTTITGDPSCFLQGIALGADWLMDNRVDACLVIGSEENQWLLSEALWQFEHSAIISNGAGALCISGDPGLSMGVELNAITDLHTYSSRQGRGSAASAMRAQLPPGSANELLCDGLSGSPRANKPESAAWRDWPGPRLSPRRILGEGLMAAAAWQCVAACDAIVARSHPAATVSLVGSNQQAIGARFVRQEM